MLALTGSSYEDRSFLLSDFAPGDDDINLNYVLSSEVGAEVECIPNVDATEVNSYEDFINMHGSQGSSSPSLRSSESDSSDDFFDELSDDCNDTECVKSDFDACTYSAPKSKRKTERCLQSRKLKRNIPCSAKRKRKLGNLSDMNNCGCKWSDLSSTQQIEVLENITQKVSQRLGLREQIELIKLISPNADVSPTDTEFFIDLELFDDDKFKRVSEFVSRQLSISEESDDQSDRSDEVSRPHRKQSRKTKNRRKPASQMWNGTNKVTIQKEILVKTHKQMIKEKRSGLFRKEQIVSISKLEDDKGEDDDIDIIG